MNDRQQWEYHVIELGSFWSMPRTGQMETALNDLGMEGWEVVGIISQYGTNQVRVVLKRLLDQRTSRQRSWPG